MARSTLSNSVMVARWAMPCSSRGSRAVRQLPVRTDEVAGVTVGITLEIILMLRLGFPELASGRDLCHHLAGPQPRRLDVGDRVVGNPLLLIAGIKNRRTIARAPIIALTVERGGIVDLEEELQHGPEARLCGIEDDLDRLGMAFVIAVSCILHRTASVANACRNHTGLLADQVLHAPETASGQNCAFRRHLML